MKIKSNTPVHDALKVSKNVLKVFQKYDLYCPQCKGGNVDTIEKVAMNNGMDVEGFLKELNDAVE